MNKNSFFFGIGGLLIGLVIGFVAANSLNRQATVGINQNISQTDDAPFQNPEVDSRVVKEQHSGGMLPEVATTLDKAKNEPENFEAQVQAGDLYLKIQNFAKALEFYQKANQLKPDNYEVIVRIGNSFYDSGQFEQAEKWYEKALEKKPDDVNVRTDLGTTFVERPNPDFDRAIKEFQTSLSTDPKHEPTLYNLAIAQYKTGKVDQARETAGKLEEVNPQSQLLTKLKQIIK
ncbi:MAG: tetratricopeptide repeat protein [Pyrinomonadaceae bacterium]